MGPSHNPICTTEAALSPWTQDLLQTIFTQSDGISLPTASELWNMTTDLDDIQEVFDDNFAMFNTG